MGLFSDVGRFFETRLDEFLKSHPHLELQAIAEQLQEQEREAMRLERDLSTQLEKIEQQLVTLAQDIQHWHQRTQQAEAGDRQDLAAAARQREAALLREGNQLWGSMQGTKQRIEQVKTLLVQLRGKREEVKVKMDEIKTSQRVRDDYTTSWETGVGDRPSSDPNDPLEAQFQQWEMDEQIRQMKQKMGH